MQPETETQCLEATRPEGDSPSHRGELMEQAAATKTTEQGQIKPTKTCTRPKAYAKPTERLTAAAALIAAGIPPEQAAIQLGYSPKSINGITQRIKDKGLSQFLTEKRVKTATGVIDTFMKGKPIGRKLKTENGKVVKDEVGNPIVLEPGIFPKDSTVKDCAMSVLDRQYPKREEQGNSSVSFTKIDVTIYHSPNPPIEAEAIP